MRISTLALACLLGLLLWALILAALATVAAWVSAPDLANCRAACVEAHLSTPK